MGNWFELGYTKMEVDTNTFRPISNDFARDKDFVYHRDKRIDLADAESFTVDDNYVIKDSKHVYFTQFSNDLKIIEGADPATYESFTENYRGSWARDASSYFLNNHKVEVDYASFRIYKNSLVADKNFLYRIDYTKDDTDWGKSFLEVVDRVEGEIQEFNSKYIIMNNCVYSHFDELEKNKFDQIDNITVVDESAIIVNKTLIINGKLFASEKADLSSFEMLENYDLNGYAKDKDAVYFQGIILDKADVNTFTVLGDGYAKDRSHVFYSDFIVEGASPNSFGLDEKQYEWKDGKTVFMYGKRFVKPY